MARNRYRIIVLEGVYFDEFPWKENDSELAKYARAPRRRPDGSLIFGHSWSAEATASSAKAAIRELLRRKRLTNPNSTYIEIHRWIRSGWVPLKYTA